MRIESVSHPSVELGIALLRIALGTTFLAQSLVLKLFIFTFLGTTDFFVTLGLPGWFAYLVFAA